MKSMMGFHVSFIEILGIYACGIALFDVSLLLLSTRSIFMLVGDRSKISKNSMFSHFHLGVRIFIFIIRIFILRTPYLKT